MSATEPTPKQDPGSEILEALRGDLESFIYTAGQQLIESIENHEGSEGGSIAIRIVYKPESTTSPGGFESKCTVSLPAGREHRTTKITQLPGKAPQLSLEFAGE